MMLFNIKELRLRQGGILCICVLMFSIVSPLYSAEVSLQSVEVEVGALVSMPVMIDEAADIASILVQINYNPQMLDLVSVTNTLGSLGESYLLFYDDSQVGSVTIILSRQDGAVSGTGVLVDLGFSLYPGVDLGSFGEIVISNVEFGDTYGGGISIASLPVERTAKVWSVFSASADSDGDGLSDYDEQIVDGSPDYNPGETDTDINNPDSDGDGIQDGYEVDNNLDPLVDDAALDSDGDGFNNFSEWIAGTGASDSDDLFEVSSISNATESGESVIRWNTVAGRIYEVLSTTNINGISWTTNLSGIAGDDSPKSYTNSSDDPSIVMRLNVSKP